MWGKFRGGKRSGGNIHGGEFSGGESTGVEPSGGNFLGGKLPVTKKSSVVQNGLPINSYIPRDKSEHCNHSEQLHFTKNKLPELNNLSYICIIYIYIYIYMMIWAEKYLYLSIG